MDDKTALLDDFYDVLANDPGALDSSSQQYVPGLHGTGPEDVIESLERAIRRARQDQIYYFSGQRGTGKSTQLRSLQKQLNGQPGTRAYLVDALEYISDTHPIDTLDLLLITASAFADRLSAPDALGASPVAEESALGRFLKFLRTEVEIKGFEIGGIKTEFKKQQQSILQRVRDFDLGRQELVMDDLRKHIGAMAAAVGSHWQSSKVVLMIDSLERLRGVGGNAAAEMFGRVVKVFDGDLNRLRIPGVQMVYAVPPYLPFLTNVKALVPIFMLASVRVCEPPGAAPRRTRRPSGMAIMRDVVERRFPRWPEVFTTESLDEFIFASGGDIRQLLRRFLLIAVDKAYYALDRLPLPASDAIVATAIESNRSEFENLVVQSDYPLLASVTQTHALDLQTREQLSMAANFFDLRAVLNYRNGVEWLDINPLLWPLIDDWVARQATVPAAHAESPPAH